MSIISINWAAANEIPGIEDTRKLPDNVILNTDDFIASFMGHDVPDYPAIENYLKKTYGRNVRSFSVA